MPQEPTIILIIRFSSLGDIIQLSALAHHLRELYPGAQIHWLTKAVYEPIVAAIPAVDKVIAYEPAGGLNGLISLAHNLRRTYHYDLVLDMHNVMRSLVARLFVGGKKRLTYHKPYFKRFLLFHFHKDTFPKDFHVIDDYCRVLGEISLTVREGLICAHRPQLWRPQKSGAGL